MCATRRVAEPYPAPTRLNNDLRDVENGAAGARIEGLDRRLISDEERVVEHIIETSNRLADLLLGKALLEDQLESRAPCDLQCGSWRGAYREELRGRIGEPTRPRIYQESLCGSEEPPANWPLRCRSEAAQCKAEFARYRYERTGRRLRRIHRQRAAPSREGVR